MKTTQFHGIHIFIHCINHFCPKKKLSISRIAGAEQYEIMYLPVASRSRHTQRTKKKTEKSRTHTRPLDGETFAWHILRDDMVRLERA